jgi:hypothetical protein
MNEYNEINDSTSVPPVEETVIEGDNKRSSLMRHRSSFAPMRVGRFRKAAKLVTWALPKKNNRNISRLKDKARNHQIIPEVYSYSQTVSDSFLEEWLDFPVEASCIFLRNIILPMRWLLWTSNNLIGLDPKDQTLRERIAASINVLGTTAGLFLVISIAAFLQPPGRDLAVPPDPLILDIFGIFMFTSSAAFIGYVAYALTVYHPILQSLRDDVLFDSFERYMKRWGGYELYLFNIGLHFMIFGLVIGAYILFSSIAVIVIVILTLLFYS